MVVSGYSFGDEGVNARIVDWTYGRRGRRLVIIDPCLDSAKERLSQHWGRWVEEGALFSLAQGIESTSWDDVLRLVSV